MCPVAAEDVLHLHTLLLASSRRTLHSFTFVHPSPVYYTSIRLHLLFSTICKVRKNCGNKYIHRTLFPLIFMQIYLGNVQSRIKDGLLYCPFSRPVLMLRQTLPPKCFMRQ
ncbi:hypothetical protein FKM82_007303 [Ascaphus truei]